MRVNSYRRIRFFEGLFQQQGENMKLLQFLRGIPFGLVFFAFMLPLFVISCAGTDKILAQASTYQSLNLVKALNNVIGNMSAEQLTDVSNSAILFTVMIFLIMIASAMGLGFSFFKRKISAILGIVALVLMVVVVCVLVSKSNEMISVSPGSGAIISIFLFVVAIALNFIPPKAECGFPKTIKIVLIVVPTAISLIIFVCNAFDFDSKAQDISQPKELIVDKVFSESKTEKMNSPQIKYLETKKDSVNQKNSITDSRDGKKYQIVKFGEKIWMTENLNYATEKSRCYENEEKNCDRYGRLYTWIEAITACPKGWNLPSEDDWKNIPPSMWNIFAGYYYVTKDAYYKKDVTAYYWTKNEIDVEKAVDMDINADADAFVKKSHSKIDVAFSVRCIKDK